MMLAPEARTRVFLPNDFNPLTDEGFPELSVVNAQSVERWHPTNADFDHHLAPELLEELGIRFEHWWLFDFTPYGAPVYGWTDQDRPMDWFWKVEIALDDHGLIPDDLWDELEAELGRHHADIPSNWILEIFPWR